MTNNKYISGLISASMLILCIPTGAIAQENQGYRGGNDRAERIQRQRAPDVQRPERAQRPQPNRTERVVDRQNAPRWNNEARQERQRPNDPQRNWSDQQRRDWQNRNDQLLCTALRH